MAKGPFIGGFNAESADQNAQERSINWMPEKIDGKTTYRMVPTPGLRLAFTLPEFPLRGAFEASNGRVFIAAGDSIYEVFNDYTYNVIGSVTGAGSSTVVIDDNGKQLVITDGTNGFVYNFASAIYTQVSSDGFFSSPSVTVKDGYAVLFKKDTGVYFYSDLYDALTYNPTDEGSAESNPDPIQMIVDSSTGLYMLGTKSLELYWNTGDANQVFQRRNGSALKYGCVAPFSALNVDDGIMWIGRDPDGQGSVYRVSGAQPTKVSTVQIDEYLQAITNLDDTTASSYQQSGHAFYLLNIPGLNTTLAYDLGTGYWHERRSFNADYTWGRWRVERHVLAFGMHFGLDYENGNVYIIDPKYRYDNDKIILRERTMTPIFDEENYEVGFFNDFKLDMIVGDGEVNPPYNDPAIGLSYSNDGGKTFSAIRYKPIGKIGEYKQVLHWRRCGCSRNRVFRVTCGFPVNATIYNAYVKGAL